MDTVESAKFPVIITGHGAHHSHGHHGHEHGHSSSHVHSIDRADMLADIRKDVGDAESEIKDAIQKLTLAQSVEFRHLNDKICETKEETIRQGLENKVKSEALQGFLTKEFGDKICGVEKTLGEMRQRAIQDRLDDSAAEVAALRAAASNNSVVLSLLSAIGIPPAATIASKNVQ